MIDDHCFYPAPDLKEVTFESGSKLRTIEERAFALNPFSELEDWNPGNCLKSIEIPASVETIGAECFIHRTALRVRFAPNSALRKIGPRTFLDTASRFADLPSGVKSLTGLSLMGLHGDRIPRNLQHFHMQDGFVVGDDGRDLIRYLGGQNEVSIPGTIVQIATGCFIGCESVQEVVFGLDQKVKRLCAQAFCNSGLRYIEIPASLEVIEKACFLNSPLQQIDFAKDCKVKRIGKCAFAKTQIRSITVPSAVEVICSHCFCACRSLREVLFEPDSKLVTIAKNAFQASGIKLFRIPSSARLSVKRGDEFTDDLYDVDYAARRSESESD
jgi:hypothetical protein